MPSATFEKIDTLPPADQRAIFKFVDALLAARISRTRRQL
jgi:hypothetical protein